MNIFARCAIGKKKVCLINVICAVFSVLDPQLM